MCIGERAMASEDEEVLTAPESEDESVDSAAEDGEESPELKARTRMHFSF